MAWIWKNPRIACLHKCFSSLHFSPQKNLHRGNMWEKCTFHLLWESQGTCCSNCSCWLLYIYDGCHSLPCCVQSLVWSWLIFAADYIENEPTLRTYHYNDNGQNFFSVIFERFNAIPAVIDRFFWYWTMTAEKSMALFPDIKILGYFFHLFDKTLQTVVFSFDSVGQNFVIPMLNTNECIARGEMIFQFYLSTGIWCGCTRMDRNEKGFVEINNERYKPSGFWIGEAFSYHRVELL